MISLKERLIKIGKVVLICIVSILFVAVLIAGLIYALDQEQKKDTTITFTKNIKNNLSTPVLIEETGKQTIYRVFDNETNIAIIIFESGQGLYHEAPIALKNTMDNLAKLPNGTKQISGDITATNIRNVPTVWRYVNSTEEIIAYFVPYYGSIRVINLNATK